MKKSIGVTLGALAFASVGFTAPALGAEFEGNVAYTTDYRFRGISQTDRNQAIQGGFDISAENGLYFGTWASTVNFYDGDQGGIEVDYYAGWANDTFDVGVLWYNYPKDGNLDQDYVELYGSYSIADFTFGLNYSNDYYAETDTFFYLYGDYGYEFAENWALNVHIGWNKFDDDEAFASFIGPAPGEDPGDDYIDYKVGVSTSALGVDWDLSVIGTDLDEEECFGDTKLCDPSVVLTVSKSL